MRERFGEFDLIVTSYGLMRRDATELAEHEFELVVLDEAQAIKNPQSQGAKAARLLKARHRLALTGTPIENHLGDLWSIFEFLNPGMLGREGRFQRLIKAANAKGREAQGLKGVADAGGADGNREGVDEHIEGEEQGVDPRVKLARALRPFILRRTKRQVLKDLPPKTEQTIVCEMDDRQRPALQRTARLLSGASAGRGGRGTGAG